MEFLVQLSERLAWQKGLLEEDHHLKTRMEEAVESLGPADQLRRLFGMLLSLCQPTNPECLGDFSFNLMVDDLTCSGIINQRVLTHEILKSRTPSVFQN